MTTRSGWPIIYNEEVGFDHYSIEKWLRHLDEENFTPEDLAGKYYLPLQTVIHAVCCRYFDVGDVAKAEKLAKKYLLIIPDPILHNLYLRCLLASPTTTKEKFREESSTWRELYANTMIALQDKDFAHFDTDPDKKITVGVLCGYAYTSLFDVAFTPLFDAIDKEKFSLVLFNIGSISDYEQHADFDRCIDMPVYSTDYLIQAIRDNKIDIVIDLNGRFRLDNPIDVLLKRVAPVQISYGNMLATYALDTIRYIMTDSYTLPPSDEKYYTEKVYRFENNVMGTFKLPDTPITKLPYLTEKNVKPNKQFVFASFNACFKLNDLVLDTWGRILQAVPNSHLFLKAGGIGSQRVQQRLVKMMKKYDLDSRITIEDATPMSDMLNKYSTVDLALNTFPYSGGTTTVYALWNGVPSVTLERDHLIQSGGGEGVLKEVGLNAFVANSVEQYINKAVYFATHPEKLAEIRKNMRKRLAKSARFNPQMFAKDFEKGLRFIWQDWVKNADF